MNRNMKAKRICSLGGSLCQAPVETVKLCSTKEKLWLGTYCLTGGDTHHSSLCHFSVAEIFQFPFSLFRLFCSVLFCFPWKKSLFTICSQCIYSSGPHMHPVPSCFCNNIWKKFYFSSGHQNKHCFESLPSKLLQIRSPHHSDQTRA